VRGCDASTHSVMCSANSDADCIPGVGSSSEFSVLVRSDRPRETDDTSPSAN
jgi:hypothetical protein